jgi:hypothetical protein
MAAVILDLVAHGGELAVSAGGVVSRVEHQENSALLQQLAELIVTPI